MASLALYRNVRTRQHVRVDLFLRAPNRHARHSRARLAPGRSPARHRSCVQHVQYHLRGQRVDSADVLVASDRQHPRWRPVLFLGASTELHRHDPARLARAVVGAGAALQGHRAGLHPHGLLHHLLALPGLRHHGRNGPVRRRGPQRDDLDDVPEPVEQVLGLPAGAAVPLLPPLHRPGQVEADARHDRHRPGRLRRQLLHVAEVRRQRPHCLHVWRLCRRHPGQPVQSGPARRRCCDFAAGRLCPGPWFACFQWSYYCRVADGYVADSD